MDKLRHRQKDFLESVGSYVTHDVLQLDYSSDAGNIPTLRQMVMEITTRDGRSNLFHSVDMDWKQDGFVFQFPPEFQDEAETTINTLIPYLSYLHPDLDVGAYFTEYAEQRCEDMIYDPATQMVIDINNENETEDFEKDKDLVGFTFSPEIAQELQRPAQQVQPN